MRIALLLASATFLWLLAPQRPSAQAQRVPDQYAQAIIDAGNNTVAHLLEKFKPHIPDNKRRLLTTKKIKVRPFADFNALARYDTQEIVIPAQLVGEVLAQAQAMIYVKNNPSSRQLYMAWLMYLTERSRKVLQNFRSRVTSIDDVVVLPFWRHAKLPAPPDLSPEDADLQARFMADALGLVLGHELGHLVLDHKHYSSITAARARQQELEADDFAVALMRKSGLSVIPGVMTIFIRFALTEEIFETFDGATSTHPSGSCRLERILRPEAERIRTSPQSRRDFERGSGMSVGQFEAFLDGVRKECAG
jgi:hypothetical protein